MSRRTRFENGGPKKVWLMGGTEGRLEGFHTAGQET
jgi:hypothetical protein